MARYWIQSVVISFSLSKVIKNVWKHRKKYIFQALLQVTISHYTQFSRINITFSDVNRRIVSRSAPKHKIFKLLHNFNAFLNFGVASPTNFGLSTFQLQTQIIVLQKKAKFKIKLFRQQPFPVWFRSCTIFRKANATVYIWVFFVWCCRHFLSFLLYLKVFSCHGSI